MKRSDLFVLMSAIYAAPCLGDSTGVIMAGACLVLALLFMLEVKP